ncbi:MAG: polysaccharide biosynthesis tyrosine autokinase, partial [Lentisphaerae bacterium]|nr:polysaccharide biosynthesis tyrosine autokinase [Lentisphaerota bacterium]
CDILAANIKAQQYRDTNLIEIRVYLREMGGSGDEQAPIEAARAANKVAEVYRKQTTKRNMDATLDALKALEESLNEKKKLVEQAEAKVEDIRLKYKINLIRPIAGMGGTIESESLRQLEAQRIIARVVLTEKKARYEKVRQLSDEDLLSAAKSLVGDSSLAILVTEKRRAEVELTRMRETYGAKHPEMIKVEAAIGEWNKKIQDAVNGLRIGVLADYEAEQAKYAILESELSALRTSARKEESEGYREFDKALEELEHAREMRDTLEVQYSKEKIALRIPKTTIELMDPAMPPDVEESVSPNLPLNIVISIIVGIGAGIALAFFIEYLDTSVKTIDDIETTMGVSVLGVIPQKVRPLTDPDADSAHAEAYRVLRTNIHFSKKLNGGKTLCVTSGSISEGKSLTLFNLAYVCAQLGDKTLLVDTDLHRPRQHKIIGMSNDVGISNVLVGEIGLDKAIKGTNVANLDFLSSGKMASSVHGLLDTLRMRDLLVELKARYDMVLFDAPPIIGVSDASLLVREVDGVLLVIQHRKYPRAVSNRAKAMVENIGGNLLGVILNNINISRDHSYYYYHQHYYSYPQKSGLGGHT